MPLSRADIEREVLYTRRFFATDEFTPCVSTSEIDSRCAELIDDLLTIASATQPLQPSEQGIVTLTLRKTAALLADRVWAADTAVDLDISFGWEIPMEVRLRAVLKLQHLFERASSDPEAKTASPQDFEMFVADVERDIALGYSDATGAKVVPLYSLTSRRDSQYRGGDQSAIISIVQNLDIVDEEQLTWEQVAEFRRDVVARRAYRRFVHWLDRDMSGMSVEFIVDDVGQRLEQYEWALRKHGIQTVIGVLSSTINPQTLVPSSGVAISAAIIVGSPIWSLLAAGGVLVGHAVLSVATALVDRRDIAMAHREIAYVQQLRGNI